MKQTFKQIKKQIIHKMIIVYLFHNVEYLNIEKDYVDLVVKNDLSKLRELDQMIGQYISTYINIKDIKLTFEMYSLITKLHLKLNRVK